jgi:transposase InsO family protein
MPQKSYRPEEIIAELREADVLLGQGKGVAEVVKALGVSKVTYRDELLDREVFHSLREAQVLIEAWRQHHDTVRPHSALGYRPPAPEAGMDAATSEHWPRRLCRVSLTLCLDRIDGAGQSWPISLPTSLAVVR